MATATAPELCALLFTLQGSGADYRLVLVTLALVVFPMLFPGVYLVFGFLTRGWWRERRGRRRRRVTALSPR